MAEWSEVVLFSPEDVGVQVQIPVWLLPLFFFFHRFFTLWLLLFILTTDPVSFARFLRKRISSLNILRNGSVADWRLASRKGE